MSGTESPDALENAVTLYYDTLCSKPLAKHSGVRVVRGEVAQQTVYVKNHSVYPLDDFQAFVEGDDEVRVIDHPSRIEPNEVAEMRLEFTPNPKRLKPFSFKVTYEGVFLIASGGVV